MIQSTAFVDSVGNAYAGIATASTLNFATAGALDTIAPAAPSMALLASSDTGNSDHDRLTADETPTLRMVLNGTGATAPDAGDLLSFFVGVSLVGCVVFSFLVFFVGF